MDRRDGVKGGMNVGDIFWVELPQAGGREQQGRRPALVIQDSLYAGALPTVLVIPLSSTKAALRFPGTSIIRASQLSGLRTDSVALVFQMRAIDKSRVSAQLGHATPDEMLQVFEELRKLTGRTV